MWKIMIKIVNLKLVILYEYQTIKIFLQKVTVEIGQKTFFNKKVKKYCAMAICIYKINCEEIVRTFYEIELQKTN